MKHASIFLHDYAGHPFQAELSRELARRGARVVHGFFADDIGPKGDLRRRPDDPEGLSFAPISIGENYAKESFVKRRFQDLRYGAAVAATIARVRPDVIISGNTPTESQSPIQRAARASGAKFVFWCQDFYSIAVSRILSRRLPVAGDAIGFYYTAVERAQMRAADAVILITEDFIAQTQKWGVARDRLHIIPNWGAIEQIPVLPKQNPWSIEHGLADKFVFLYSGTIGLKHNPALLVALAKRYRTDPRVLWAQGHRYGKSRPMLVRKLKEAGRPRPPRFAGWRSWAWLVAHLLDLRVPERRSAWVWVAGNRLGQLEGSVRYRALFI